MLERYAPPSSAIGAYGNDKEVLAMKADSMDLRERVLKDSDAGIRTREVAVKYAVSESWVRRLKQRRRENGETAPRSSRNRLQPKWLPDAKRL